MFIELENALESDAMAVLATGNWFWASGNSGQHAKSSLTISIGSGALCAWLEIRVGSNE